MKTDPHTNKKQYEELLKKYEKRLEKSKKIMNTFLKTKKWDFIIKQTLSLHTIWIEIKYLKTMYLYNEVNEHIYIYLLAKLHRQQDRIEKWETQIQPGQEHNLRDNENFIVHFLYLKYYRITSVVNQYLINRTKFLITGKVIKKLEEMKKILFWFDEKHFDELLTMYKDFHIKAKESINILQNNNKKKIESINKILLSKTLMKVEESEITQLLDNQIITENIYKKFKDQTEDEIIKEYCDED